MNTYKKNAIFVGVFYIAATAAGILGVVFGPNLDDPDYLINISANENQVIIGSLFVLMMAVAVSGVAIAVYPVLKKHNESIAIGYVGARLVEGIIFIVTVISWLLLLTLSQEYVKAGAPDASYFQTSGELLLAVGDWAGHVVLDVAVFPLGALIFYGLLYQSKLVPRWISGWGLIAAILYWAAGFLIMFALVIPMSTMAVVLNLPLALQEMVLAVWLIVKGFNSSAIASGSA